MLCNDQSHLLRVKAWKVHIHGRGEMGQLKIARASLTGHQSPRQSVGFPWVSQSFHSCHINPLATPQVLPPHRLCRSNDRAHASSWGTQILCSLGLVAAETPEDSGGGAAVRREKQIRTLPGRLLCIFGDLPLSSLQTQPHPGETLWCSHQRAHGEVQDFLASSREKHVTSFSSPSLSHPGKRPGVGHTN